MELCTAPRLDQGPTSPARRVAPAEERAYRRVIDEKKRPVVVDIFAMYADGMNPKAIAAELNRRKVPSPGADWNREHRRGDGKWMGSAIYSMLDNEIYAGEIVWNRGTWVLDPETDRRVCEMNPESDWVRVKMPKLRIVSPKLWKQVKDRQAQVQKDNAKLRESLKVLRNGNPAGRRATNFWSGLLVCGKCGRSFIKVSQYRYGCGSYANGGEHACGNDQHARVSVLDRKILATIKDDLLTPARLKLMERAMREHFDKQISQIKSVVAKEQSATRLAELERELSNVVAAIAKLGLDDELTKKLAELKAEKKTVEATKRAGKTDPRLAYDLAALLPKLIEHEKRVITEIAANRHGPDRRVMYRAQQAVRRLVGSITLDPTKHGLVARLELTGERIALMMEDASVRFRSGFQQNQTTIKMVAGVRYTPHIQSYALTKDHPLLLAA